MLLKFSTPRGLSAFSYTGILGSNSARALNVCPRFSILNFPGKLGTLRWADFPSNEFYQILKDPKLILNRNAPEGIWGSGGIAPRILYLGTGWTWLVSFILRPL